MFENLIKKILKKEKAKGEINVVLLDPKEMKRLNRKFRRKDKATDVLSFPMGEDGILGEIAISRREAEKNARKLVVHGVLHLLGYEHGRKMTDAEKVYEKL